MTTEHGDRKIIVADGHDVGGSHMCRDCVNHGYTGPRYTGWLTPSGQVLEEGKSYQMQWVERFRGARSGSVGPNRTEYTLLRYRGAWEIISEALDMTENGT